MKKQFVQMCLILLICLANVNNSHGQSIPKFKVIAFYNASFDAAHISFANECNTWFPLMAKEYGFEYTSTKNWGNINANYLANYDVVLFIDDQPPVAQRAAFEQYMKNGGAWMGFHVCAFNTNPGGWDWYFNQFLGMGAFKTNTWGATSAILNVENHTHPVTKNMPDKFTSAVSEWYGWNVDLRTKSNIDILCSVNPESFPLGTDPNQSWYSGYYPIVWSNKDYKMIYNNFGHNDMNYSNNTDLSNTFTVDIQNKMVIESLFWLAGVSFEGCDKVSDSSNDGNVAGNVLDKNLGTRWSANGDGQWIKFCLGRDSIPVNTIHVAFYNGNQRTSTFDVEVSHDGANWTKALTNAVSSGTSLALETFTFPLQYTKFLRLLGHGNSVNTFNSYTEIGIDTAHVAYASISIPGIIQAENFDIGGEGVAYHDATATHEGSGFRTNSTVDIEACTDAGGGYNVGWTANGEWLNYTVDVTVAGTYAIALRSAALNTGGAVQFYVDNVAATSVINLPVTGGYQTWQTSNATTSFALTPGRHTIKLNIITSGFNLNYMDFQPHVVTGLDEILRTIVVYPNPVVDELQIRGINTNTELTLLDIMGKVVLRQTTSKDNEKISVSDFPEGIYFLRVSTNDASKTMKIMIQ